MAPDPVNRRAFCRQVCQATSTAALASWLHGCSGGSSSPNPGAPTPPPADPPPAPPPTPPPSPPPPQPPPPSGPPVELRVISSTHTANTIVVTIDAASPLAPIGGAALTQVFVGEIQRTFLLAHPTGDVFTAVSGICTHEGCVVSRFTGAVFVCPCHGSRYETNGTVVQGPAPAALPRFNTRYENGVLTILL